MGTYSDPEKMLGPRIMPVKHQAKCLLGKRLISEAKRAETGHGFLLPGATTTTLHVAVPRTESSDT